MCWRKCLIWGFGDVKFWRVILAVKMCFLMIGNFGKNIFGVKIGVFWRSGFKLDKCLGGFWVLWKVAKVRAGLNRKLYPLLTYTLLYGIIFTQLK